MANNDTKIISEQDLYQAKYWRVFKRTLERNGKVMTKDMLSRVSVVHVIAVTDADEMYLVSQYRDALNEETFEIPAGHMDEGEEPLAAAKRELAEETGLTAENWEHLITYNQGANFSGKVHVFIATDLSEGDTNFDEDEDIELVKFPVEEVLTKTLNGEISVASNIATLQVYNSMKRQKHE